MKITKAIYAILFLAVIILTSCNNSGSSSRQKSPEELRMELKQQEQSNPNNYLSAKGNYKKNFWGDKFNVSCVITNTASIATFKDAVVRVTYYSKTNTVLGNKDYTVYEMFPPSSSKTIELKIDNYNDVNSIGLDIVKSIPAQ
ncbi:MAG TPA: hypothetical protein DCL77_09425 [Prolixibacteraceae bacterium]|nr:hypothetical protein [Prolixibacteraceae bacterium]